MRLVTSACVALAAWGCWNARAPEGDAGDAAARDVSALDGPSTDARSLDAPAADALRDAPIDPVLPSCALPVAAWAETREVYPGRREHAARMRLGDETWIAARDARGVLEVLRFDFDGAVPRLVTVNALEFTAGPPLAAARDDLRMAIAGLEPGVGPVVSIFDPDGRPLGRASIPEAAGAEPRLTLAVRSTRIGLAIDREMPALALIDAAGGALLRVDRIAGSAGSIGLGRGLFTAITTTASGDASQLWGFDDAGLIDAGRFMPAMRRVDWDESTAVGLGPAGELVVRTPGAAPRILEAGADVEGTPSIAVRGAELWAAYRTAGGLVAFVDGETGLVARRAVVEGATDRGEVMAHVSRRHRGAFVLSRAAAAIVWVGWSCEPDR